MSSKDKVVELPRVVHEEAPFTERKSAFRVPMELGNSFEWNDTPVSLGHRTEASVTAVKHGDFGTASIPGLLRGIGWLLFGVASEVEATKLRHQKRRHAYDHALAGFSSNRDFLGLQLSHAWGNVPEEDFRFACDHHLSTKEQAISGDVRQMITTLARTSSVALDAETLSEVFNVRLHDVERLLMAIHGEDHQSAL